MFRLYFGLLTFDGPTVERRVKTQWFECGGMEQPLQLIQVEPRLLDSVQQLVPMVGAEQGQQEDHVA